MPPRPPLANTVKCELNWAGPDGSEAANIFYILANETVSDPSDLALIAALVNTAVQVDFGWVNKVSHTWTLNTVRAIDNSGATENVASLAPAAVGGVESDACTPNVALCMSWPIAAHYRGGHPRTYVAGIPTADLDTAGGKNFTSGTQSVWEEIGTGLIAAIGESVIRAGVDLALGAISYYTGGALRATPLFRTFLGTLVGSRIDSQRRRTGKEIALT